MDESTGPLVMPAEWREIVMNSAVALGREEGTFYKDIPKHIKDLRKQIEETQKRNAHLEKVTEEACIELKEWRIRFPHNDPTIARRMVEDRARAEALADAARGEGEWGSQ
jgi:hypothetical protein